MPQEIRLKSSNVAGKVPTTSELNVREIALNTADGKGFIKDSSDVIKELIIADTSNSSNGQIPMIDGDGNIEMHYADRAVIKIKADEVITLGDPLYITGIQGDGTYNVSKADASNSAKMPAIGIAQDNYILNDQGFATLIGDFKGFDTSLLSVNESLFVGIGGGLTTTRPSGENDLIQKIARVGSSAINGDLVVIGAGRSNDVPNSADFVSLTVGGSTVLTDDSTYVKNDTDTFTSTAPVNNIVSLTQLEYDALLTKDANTFYVIV